MKRNHLTAVMMIALLGGSLGGAYMFTDGRRHWKAHLLAGAVDELATRTIGDLQVPVPASWLPHEQASFAQMRSQAVFTSDTRRSAILVIGELSDRSPRTPQGALDQAMRAMLDHSQVDSFTPSDPAHPFRLVTRVGLRVTGASGVGDAAMQHQFAVITENGRRYWSISLHFSAPHSKDAPLLDDNLLTVMCTRARQPSRAAAREVDFTSAGLRAGDIDVGDDDPVLDAHVTRPHHAGDPIELIATEGEPQVLTARVRGIADAGATDPVDPLSPALLLQARYRELTGTLPDEKHWWAGTLQLDGERTAEAWRLTFDSVDQSPAQWLYYVRKAPGSGMLIELIGPGDMAARLTQWIAPIVDALAPGVEPPAIADAIIHGEVLADQLRDETLRRLDAGDRYFTIERAEQMAGLAIERVRRSSRAGEAWRGDAIAHMQGADGGHSVFQWSIGDDGKAFTWLRVSRGSLMSSSHGIHLQGRGDRLDQLIVRPDRETKLNWTTKVGPSYVSPVALEYWPPTALDALAQRPAVIWYTDGHAAPQPWWVTAGADAHDGLIVQLRPLTAMDGDQLSFDSTGQLVARYHRPTWTPRTGGASVRTRLVDRETLIALFPDAAEKLIDSLAATGKTDD